MKKHLVTHAGWAFVFALGFFLLDARCLSDDSRQVERRTLLERIKYTEGEVRLREGVASIRLSDSFRYIDPAGTETLITGVWGNPPSGGKILGAIVVKDFDPFGDSAWCVLIHYDEDGYVSDSDAEKINYETMLADMKRVTAESNTERRKKGYSAVELVGWAVPPRYDKESRKFYWAKELKFGESASTNTLNYNIRVLGRRGVLVLNAVASMSQLKEVEAATPEILGMVNFTPGNMYTDYNPGTDKLATYGLAALVAGGIAAKSGFFKMVFAALIASKKLIPVAVVGAWALVKRIFSGRAAKDPLKELEEKRASREALEKKTDSN